MQQTAVNVRLGSISRHSSLIQANASFGALSRHQARLNVLRRPIEPAVDSGPYLLVWFYRAMLLGHLQTFKKLPNRSFIDRILRNAAKGLLA